MRMCGTAAGWSCRTVGDDRAALLQADRVAPLIHAALLQAGSVALADGDRTALLQVDGVVLLVTDSAAMLQVGGVALLQAGSAATPMLAMCTVSA